MAESDNTGSGRRRAAALQIKLTCADVAEVRDRFGAELKALALFVRTKTPKPEGTLIRLDLRLADGRPLLKAAANVERSVAPSDAPGAPAAGMHLKFLGADKAGRELFVSLGVARPPPLLREEQAPPATVTGQIPRVQPPEAAPASASAPSAVVESASAPSGRPAPPAGPPPMIRPGPPPAEVAAPPPPAPALTPAPGPPKKPTGPVIGIDLGTTNSAAAFVTRGRPFVIPSREGYNTIPSIIAFNEKGKLIVGHPAKGQMLTNPKNTVYGAKRLVGRAYTSPIVEQIKGRFQYTIVEGPKGEAAVQLGPKVFTLQEISAMVLREVKEIAQNHLAQPVERAVITVPAYYNDNQRQAVREAGALAGLHVERILNEPTAAALAFGYGRQLEQRVLVFDLGGGTFDVSVLELHPGNVYEVVSTGGDTFLGGVDFDNEIVTWLLGKFAEKNGVDFPGDRVALQRVVDAAERAKIALSEQNEMRVLVPFIALVGDKPYDLDVKIGREQLIALTQHLVDRTIKTAAEVLAARKLTVKDIDEVLLVGGQSRMPYVRQRIREYFGKEPSKAVHPDEAVALGAAVLADTLTGTGATQVVLIDVLPMAIGIGLPGGRFKRIIEHNTSLPHSKTYTILTHKDDQDAIEMTLFQGEHERAIENEYLGTLRFDGLPKGPRGSVAVEVTFQIGAECLLTAVARERRSGREEKIVLSTRDTPEAIKLKLAGDGPGDASGATPGKGGARRGGGLMAWLKGLFSRPPKAPSPPAAPPA